MTRETKEIVIKNYDITQVSEMQKMAETLKHHIAKHKLFTEIAGRAYVHVDGWEFAGGMLGILPQVIEMRDLSKGDEVKWMAEVEIVDKADRVISRGYAVCSNKENKKKNFDEYAIMSMAQTRAIGKAYRNVLAWIMKLSGYETTPSEEVQVDSKDKAPAIAGLVADAILELRKCKNIDQLQKVYQGLKPKVRSDDEVQATKEEMKRKLSQ